MRLFRTYAGGNFIAAGVDTTFLQTGETPDGKPILGCPVTRDMPLPEAARCILVSFDSTMRSNLCDRYFTALGSAWADGVRQMFRDLPALAWQDES